MKIEHPLLKLFLRSVAIDLDTLLMVTIVARLPLSNYLLINILLSSFFASRTFLCRILHQVLAHDLWIFLNPHLFGCTSLSI